ncbi:ABC transporter permease [Dermabacteraceae bacterium P13115]|nr:ABC transporter permease subunit [Dermabacteraceae bacterium TAE3-ERU5]
MNYFVLAYEWLADKSNWAGPGGIGARLLEHLGYTLAVVAIACLIAVPCGWAIGHFGKGRRLVLALSTGARSLPTLGLLTLLGIWWGIGLEAPLAALVVLAIPSVLTGAYTGVEAVGPEVRDAARAQGMTGRQLLFSVEVPLGLPLLLSGIRAATLQVVATATLAAYVGAGGLGRFLFLGLKTQDYGQMLAASLLVMLLALALDLLLVAVQRLLVPRGVRPLMKGQTS